jgi:hypothetical protein
MHAGLAMLVTLIVWRLRPLWAPVAMLYTLAMAVALVYLGEHYVVDVLAGWGTAAAGFALVWLAEVGLAPIRRAALPLAQRVPWCMRRRRAAPHVPQWATATRGALYPGVPLVLLLIVMAGPLGYRPSARLIAALPPPRACAETPSPALADIAADAHSIADEVLLFVADEDNNVCYVADPESLLPAQETGRLVRIAGLYRLATDASQEWDPAVPDGALTVRQRVTVPTEAEADTGTRAYSVLVILRGLHDPDTARAAAEPIGITAAGAVRPTEGG